MAVINDLVRQVEKCIDQNNRLEAHIVRLDRRQNESFNDASVKAIQKTMARSGSKTGYSVGYVGSDGDQLALMDYIGSGRQKSIGWGGYLSDLKDICQPQADVRTIGDRIEKRWGAKEIKKSALAEQAGATGGYTVPIQFYADLMRLLGEESFTRQLSTILPMQSRTMYVPAVDQSASPALGSAAWWGGITATFQPEAQSITNSQPAFRQLALEARDLVFTCVSSNQLLQDNAIGLDTILTTMFQEAMAWTFDWYMLRGNGANQPLGTLNAPCAITTGGNNGNTARITANEFHLQDIAAMMSRLLLSSWKNAVWVCHPSVLGQLIQMTTAVANATPNGNVVWMNPYGNQGTNEGPASLATPFSILGRPVYFSEKVPSLGTAGDVQLVDFSKMLVGDRMAIQIETSNQYLFQTNQVIWRIIQRWDAQPWLNLPVILADGSGSYKVSNIILLG